MPALSRFGAGNRGEKKQTVIQKLTEFFEKFFGIIA
jgi:type I restriction enzyme R subunit